jgi:hypothetical protein
MTAFKRSQAKYVRKSYKTSNWPEYEAGLRQRGSLTVWISEDELSRVGVARSAASESLADRSSTPTMPLRQL